MAENSTREGSVKPSAKTWYIGLGGAIVTIGTWSLSTFANVEVPAEVSAAAVLVVSFIVAATVPAKWGKYIDVSAVLNLGQPQGGADGSYGLIDDSGPIEGDDVE